jgi:hypothetical protein
VIQDHGRQKKKLWLNRGGRMMGRPRIRWLEDAENDNQEMKVKIWRQKAVNREGLWVCI